MTNPLSNQLMRATLARFEADRQEALAIMELYLNAPVGVGEHPNLVTELTTATRQLADAEEALETLNRNFLNLEESETEEPHMIPYAYRGASTLYISVT